MTEYEASTSYTHKIESNQVLACAETGRVVAVFYNDYDLDHVIAIFRGEGEKMSNNMTSKSLIEHVYRVGYVTAEKKRDYDPLGNKVICDAIERLRRLEGLAKEVADGNFNHCAIIAEAKLLIA